ncbi:MAG: redoxin domain-containing protein [Bacteroidota bacterium]
MRWIYLFALVLGLASCKDEDLFTKNFELTDGQHLTLDSALQENDFTVLIFVSPECPLCQNYSVTFSEIIEEYNAEGIRFYGVLSGKYYTGEEMNEFLRKYDLTLPVIVDPKFSLANHYEATITPEVVLVNNSGEELYQGAIDNWAISLGQKRIKTTEFYLKDALTASLVGTEISPSQTKPVGCYIE